MKIQKFLYEKDENITEREVVIFQDNDVFIEGLDLSKIDQKTREELLKIIEEWEEKLKPYKKMTFRRFNKVNIRCAEDFKS